MPLIVSVAKLICRLVVNGYTLVSPRKTRKVQYIYWENVTYLENLILTIVLIIKYAYNLNKYRISTNRYAVSKRPYLEITK